ncbi:MAG: hypothetical protein AAFV45_07570 [Pseudomonadota bacterium]
MLSIPVSDRRRDRRRVGLVCLLFGLAWFSPSHAQDIRVPEAPAPDPSAQTFDIVAPPSCTNSKGETVAFIETRRGRPGLAAGMARRDREGQPVVIRSNFGAAPPAFQSFIDRHECAHHQTGDVDRPHPPRNGPEHLMNESISDCIAIMRLRDEEGYDGDGLAKVAETMRRDMAKIGFPEISISSRLSNVRNCFAKTETATAYIDKVLTRRGLK